MLMGTVADRQARTTLKRRFCLGLVLTLLPLLVAVAIGFWAIQGMTGAVDRLVAEAVDEIAPVEALWRQVHDLSDAIRVAGGEAPMPLAESVLADIDRSFDRLAGVAFIGAGEREALSGAREIWSGLRGELHQSPPGNGRLYKADLLLKLEQVEARLDRIHHLALAEMNLLHAQVVDHRRTTGIFLGAVVLMALALSILTGLHLSRSVLAPLQSLRRGVLQLGEGDLSARVAEVGQDELADLARTFNQMAVRLEESHRELAELSACDYLTGLNNVREFYRLFHEETRRSDRYGHVFTLLLLDVDLFKEINDTFGHQTGDYVLQEVARRLKSLVRVNDHVARIGGDEFSILLPETGQEEARDLAERIRADFHERAIPLPQHPDDALRMTVSIGMATYPVDAEDAGRLFARADAALYLAKDGGRNRLEVASKESHGDDRNEEDGSLPVSDKGGR
ncbi:MAG: hypothetical protein Kow00100_22680 [Geothermobacteraceae bacterium]